MSWIENNCDGSGPHSGDHTRRLPTGGGSNLILCQGCFRKEIAFRFIRNKELEPQNHYPTPQWKELEAYDAVYAVNGPMEVS